MAARQQSTQSDPIPCLVMSEGDDAGTIEASLAEDIERLPMDEVDQYKAFAKLIKEGRDTDEIAASFGITERMVTQRLALGRLHPPILTAYRKGDIHAGDIRTLTMATPKLQKAWWALMKDEEAFAPTGYRLKGWLFGGDQIPTCNALFDVEGSGHAVIADLFSEDSYFVDSEAFWTMQNAAIAEAMGTMKTDGWADVILMGQGGYLATWEHCTCAKEDGGKVFVAVATQGEVIFHKGYFTKAEAKRREKIESGEPVQKPELTKAAQNYVDLHRHATVRADMLGQSGLALRLVIAQTLTGSLLWNVEPDPQKSTKPEISESLEANTAQQTFEAERAEIAALLGVEAEQILPKRSEWQITRPDLGQMLAYLMTLNDEDALRILTFLVADSLSAQSPIIDDLEQICETDMSQHRQPEGTFFALIRDKQVLYAMVGDYAGRTAAAEHITATAKTQRAILTACLDGTRPPADPNWMPCYMAFPQGSYRVETGEAQ